MLTKTEHTVYKLNAVGRSYKEMADFLKIKVETVKSHMKNLKIKKGLQKSSELAALYWCEMFGASFEEQRKIIMESCMTTGCVVLIVIFSFVPDLSDKNRRTEQRRNNRCEVRHISRRNEYSSAA